MERLTRATIFKAFEALGTTLPGGTAVSLVVAGGAALVLLYGARDSTKDVGAFLLNPADADALRRAAGEVAVTLGLPHDWLNDGVKGYVHGLALGEMLFRSPGITVQTLAPHQLLAMKLSAWRDDVDIDDARLLMSKLAGDRDQVWREIEPHLVPGRELKAQYAFADLWETSRGPA